MCHKVVKKFILGWVNMGNKQGLLPNKLNKYSIRKFTVGTASLLVGATLVFGIGSEAQAAELDTITKEDVKSQDKGEALDIKILKNQKRCYYWRWQQCASTK